MSKPQNQDQPLTEAEIAARFESTVRRMANTKPAAKRASKKRLDLPAPSDAFQVGKEVAQTPAKIVLEHSATAKRSQLPTR